MSNADEKESGLNSSPAHECIECSAPAEFTEHRCVLHRAGSTRTAGQDGCDPLHAEQRTRRALIDVEIVDETDNMVHVGTRGERAQFQSIGWVRKEHLKPWRATYRCDEIGGDMMFDAEQRIARDPNRGVETGVAQRADEGSAGPTKDATERRESGEPRNSCDAGAVPASRFDSTIGVGAKVVFRNDLGTVLRPAEHGERNWKVRWFNGEVSTWSEDVLIAVEDPRMAKDRSRT